MRSEAKEREGAADDPSVVQPGVSSVPARKRPPGRTKKYGPRFQGAFTDPREDMEAFRLFKDFYMEQRVLRPKEDPKTFVGDFNALIEPKEFFPSYQAYKRMCAQFDKQIAKEHRGDPAAAMVLAASKRNKRVFADLGPRNEEQLDLGVRTLAGLLVDDAVGLVREEARDPDDHMGSNEFVKRRMYALNVLNHVGRTLKGKAEIRLRSAAEKRETAGFLMGIMNKALSGKISPEQLEAMKGVTRTHGQ